MAKRRSALDEVANEKCELEMTPMIDVTFLLLIFFMCTLKFKILEGKLGAYLPKDVGVQPIEAEPIEKVDIRLEVQNPGTMMKPAKGGFIPYTPAHAEAGERFVWGPDRVVEYTVNGETTTNLTTIVQQLAAFKRADDEVKATVDARSGITQKDVVIVLDAAIDAGYSDITFKGSFER